MYRHIWPNVMPYSLANAFLTFAFALVSLAALSYLGLGVGPGAADWGRMLSESRTLLLDNPAAAIAPGVAIALTAVASASWAIGSRSGFRNGVVRDDVREHRCCAFATFALRPFVMGCVVPSFGASTSISL